jgi:hypothetical protein
MISAMTLGCLRGLRINARNLVRTTTKHIWRIAKGSAKFRGLSPWNHPFDVAFIGAGQTIVDTLVVAIDLQLIDSINEPDRPYEKRDYNRCHAHITQIEKERRKSQARTYTPTSLYLLSGRNSSFSNFWLFPFYLERHGNEANFSLLLYIVLVSYITRKKQKTPKLLIECK